MFRIFWPLLAATFLAGCTHLPASGPGRDDLDAAPSSPAAGGVQLVDVDDRVARTLAARSRTLRFSEDLGPAAEAGSPSRLGAGDVVEVTIWKAPPTTLFGAGLSESRRGPSAARPAVLPEQVIDRDGHIVVPFAGRIPAAGQTLRSLGDEIAQRFRGKANQPGALTRATRQVWLMVRVVGGVTDCVCTPLKACGAHLVNARMAWHCQGPSRPCGPPATAPSPPMSLAEAGATRKTMKFGFENQGVSRSSVTARQAHQGMQ